MITEDLGHFRSKVVYLASPFNHYNLASSHIVDSPSNSYHNDSTASNTFREEELD